MTGETQNYSCYRDQFQYSGDRIYELIYERNREHIRTKRRTVAVINLRRIFEHTFEISKRVGFREMSLRQLSHESGISIGGIYACIESKQALAQMACDSVTYIALQHVQMTFVPLKKVVSLREFLSSSVYMAEVMHEWLRFLFVDVRSLSDANEFQLSRLSELFASGFKRLRILEGEAFEHVSQSGFSPQLDARLALLVVGDWVQQRERFLQQGISVDDYADYVAGLLVRVSPSAIQAATPANSVEAISGIDVL